jgi:hypothetical protein
MPGAVVAVRNRVDKEFCPYVSGEEKQPLKHLSEPSGGSTGSSSPLGAQTEVFLKLRSVQFSFLDQKWAI